MARSPRTLNPNPPELVANRFARLTGKHAPARAVAQAAAVALAARGISVTGGPDGSRHAAPGEPADYAQIDPSLARADDQAEGPPPPSGVGYAGLNPAQRAHFLRWLDHPQHDAPAAFRRLYLGHIECALLEAAAARDQGTLAAAVAALRELDAWPIWREDAQRTRTLLLAFRLLGDGPALADWIATGAPFPGLVGLALGQQALLGVPLGAREVVALAMQWGLVGAPVAESVVALRLTSLAHSLKRDPLAHALAALGDEAQAPLPWRCAHRDLRLALPQPDPRPTLEPLLAEMLDDIALAAPLGSSGIEIAPETALTDDEEAAGPPGGWSLVLEFGNSRSEYFEFALAAAQRLPGYAAILDEQRHMVHRVVFHKSEMRRFWNLWDYVQNWAGTRVYVNGVELAKWKIWPYSQYMR